MHATIFGSLELSCLYILLVQAIYELLAGRLSGGTDRPKFLRLGSPRKTFGYLVFKKNMKERRLASHFLALPL